MFAATESATCLPALSLMAFATSSQVCFLREEITTFAPCSAIRSAMARPMPREEPVMTATFPDMSNKVMFLSQSDPALAAGFSFQLNCVHVIRQCQASLVSDTISGPAG